MPSNEKKLYRMIFQYEVLTDDPNVANMNCRELAYETGEGGSSGVFEHISTEEVTPERMAELLIAQGSDPDFLLGDDWEKDETEEESPNSCDNSKNDSYDHFFIEWYDKDNMPHTEDNGMFFK